MTKKYYVVHNGTSVVRTGSCPSTMLLDQATEPGQVVVEWPNRVDPDQVTVVDGAVVLKEGE